MGPALAAINQSPSQIVAVFQREAEKAMKLKTLEI